MSPINRKRPPDKIWIPDSQGCPPQVTVVLSASQAHASQTAVSERALWKRSANTPALVALLPQASSSCACAGAPLHPPSPSPSHHRPVPDREPNPGHAMSSNGLHGESSSGSVSLKTTVPTNTLLPSPAPSSAHPKAPFHEAPVRPPAASLAAHPPANPFGTEDRDTIGEHEMKTAFEQIVHCIDLDDEEVFVPHAAKDRPFVPDLNSPEGSIGKLSLTPQSSPGHSSPQGPHMQCSPPALGLVLGGAPPPVGFNATVMENFSNFSPSHRLPRSPKSEPTASSSLLHSPAPLSMKSFLDDDWLRDRVKHDTKMAQVAGGLVRSSSSPPDNDCVGGASSVHGHGYGNGSGGGNGHANGNAHSVSIVPSHAPAVSGTLGSNAPPGDYICKLCSVPGHWLKDCHLYEPRSGAAPAGSRSATHSRTASMSSLASRSSVPPGNYICRLCNIPGHWIEQCAKFQPKLGKSDLVKSSMPPKNYICNLCHRPGHWIQQCSEFMQMPSHHRRSLSSERGRYF